MGLKKRKTLSIEFIYGLIYQSLIDKSTLEIIELLFLTDFI